MYIEELIKEFEDKSLVKQLYFLILYSELSGVMVSEDILFPKTKLGIVSTKNISLEDRHINTKKILEDLDEYIPVLNNKISNTGEIEIDIHKKIYMVILNVKKNLSLSLRRIYFSQQRKLRAYDSWNLRPDKELYLMKTIIRVLVDSVNKKYEMDYTYDKNIIFNKAEITPHIVYSVHDFLKVLNSITHAQKDSDFFYRGQSNYTFDCIPSLFRITDYEKKEKIMKDELTIMCSKEIDNCRTNFDKLVLMQHYDLPTRLMDLTSNPLVALFFACQEYDNIYGEIIIYECSRLVEQSYDSNDVTILASLSELDKSQKQYLYKSTSNNSQYLDILFEKCVSDKRTFNKKITNLDLKKCLFVRPKLNNNRIERQSGAFLIMGLFNQGEAMIAHNLLRYKQHRIYIDAYFKKEILKQLSMLSINKARLFPEIDSVANHIKNKYK